MAAFHAVMVRKKGSARRINGQRCGSWPVYLTLTDSNELLFHQWRHTSTAAVGSKPRCAFCSPVRLPSTDSPLVATDALISWPVTLFAIFLCATLFFCYALSLPRAFVA